jgi:hypothetical protein
LISIMAEAESLRTQRISKNIRLLWRKSKMSSLKKVTRGVK